MSFAVAEKHPARHLPVPPLDQPVSFRFTQRYPSAALDISPSATWETTMADVKELRTASLTFAREADITLLV